MARVWWYLNRERLTMVLPEIGDTRADWTRPWFGDWLNALAGLIMGNINYDGNQTFNVVEKCRIGNHYPEFIQNHGIKG